MLPSAPASNRRASRRAGLRCSCELLLPRQISRSGTTLDVGVEGMSFLSARPIAPGTQCSVSFELPLAGRSVTVQGKLKTVYSSYQGTEGFKIGAVFTAMDVGCAEALLEFAAYDS